MKTPLRSRMPAFLRRSVIGGAALFGLAMHASAQVSLYAFSQSVGTYTEITEADGGYSLGTPTFDPPLHNLRAWVDPNDLVGTVTNGGYLAPAIGPGFPIGFDLTYNGDVFDRIGIAHGGWISFGKSSDGAGAVVCFTSDHQAGRPLSHSYWATPLAHAYQRNRVAGWGSSELRMQNLGQLMPPGPVSSLRVATIGTAPNRVCVIQWKDFRHNYSVDNYRINFQIRLNESDNSVEVRFGPMEWGWNEARPQIGLGGTTSEDFNNRVVVYAQPAFLYDWNNTAPGTLNTDAMITAQPQPGQPNGSGVVPQVGRSFKWTPSVCPPPGWPVTNVSIGLGTAEFQWEPVPGAVSYDYVVSLSPDPTAPSPVAAENTTEPYLFVEGLDTLLTYYVHVRTNCAGGAGPWGDPTPFRSAGGAVLECGGEPIEQYHCNTPGQQTTWYYYNSDGFSPVRVQFSGGTFTSGSSFRVFNGPDTTSALLYNSTSGNALAGQVYTSTGPSLTMKMIGHETAGCSNTDFLEPIEWRLGCKDCTEPLVQFALGEVDCEAGEYFVNANIFSLGNATEVVLENDLGMAFTTASATGAQVLGPFPTGESVLITAVHPMNSLCNMVAPLFENPPCAIQDCGPTWYEECATQSELETWLFEGEGQAVSVRILPVDAGFDARIRTYDGDSDLATQFPLIGGFGGFNNEVFTSTNAGHHLLMQYQASQYEEYLCSEGNSVPLEFVVGCVTECEQPRATFAYADCTEPATFSVVVNVTDLGSTGSVTITNDGGAPDVTASATGSYTVGPFASGSSVRLDVEGADAICTWSSYVMTYSCLNMGLPEQMEQAIQLYPNPSNGLFRLAMPAVWSGRTELQVLDLTGRLVAQDVLVASGEVVLDLQHLPTGLYTVVARNARYRSAGRISIQH